MLDGALKQFRNRDHLEIVNPNLQNEVQEV